MIGQPRIHGNGFIQVDLDEKHRLHIWDHRIPRQRTDSSIHDHAFGFQSRILKGTLVNVLLRDVMPDKSRHTYRPATHTIYRVTRGTRGASGTGRPRLSPEQRPWSSPGEETFLTNSRRRVRFEPATTLVMEAGNGYAMPPMAFHVSLHLGTTVTVMKKGGSVAHKPRVAVRIGERPDNWWIRDQEIPVWAWQLLEEYGPAPHELEELFKRPSALPERMARSLEEAEYEASTGNDLWD